MPVQYKNIFLLDISKGETLIKQLPYMGRNDMYANRIGVEMYNGATPFPPGGSCFGEVVLSDDSTVPIEDGVVSGNLVYVDLTPACYSVPGPIRVAVKWTDGTTVTTLLQAFGTISLTETDKVINIKTINDSVSALTHISLTESGYIKDDGQEADSNDYHRTGYIPVYSDSVLILDGFYVGSASGSAYAYYFYDSSKAAIAGEKGITGRTVVTTIPGNAAYVRFSSRTMEGENPVAYVSNHVVEDVADLKPRMTDAEGNISALQSAVAGKQDTLTFDDTPTANSENPVKSGGVYTRLNEKVAKPATDGTNGQLLWTNGDGTTQWVDQGTPTDEQVGVAVDAWLDEHPEATTTVEDGSITKAKLNSDLQDTVDDVADLKSAILDRCTIVNSPAIAKGKYISPSGAAWTNNTKYAYAGTIQGYPKVVAYRMADPTYVYKVIYYDSTGDITTGTGWLGASSEYTSGVTFIPSNAVKLGINVHRADFAAISDSDKEAIKSALIVYCPTDTTLSKEYFPADAKAVSDAIAVAEAKEQTDFATLFDIVSSSPVHITVPFTAASQNVQVSFPTTAGKRYLLSCSDSNLQSGFLTVYASEDSSNYAKIYKDTPVVFTASVNAQKLKFYNGNASASATVIVDYIVPVGSVDEIKNLDPEELAVTFTGASQNLDTNYAVEAGKTYFFRIDDAKLTAGYITVYVPADSSNYKKLYKGQTVTFTPSVSGFLRFYNGPATMSAYDITVKYGYPLLGAIEKALAVEPVYYVGPTRANTSLTSLLLDLAGNTNPKTIYIDEGTYDMFAEYMAEVNADTHRITIPPDNVESSDYFGTYNAFVPNNTKIIGRGNVVLQFTPQASEITYGASRTWSPLNIYGSVEIENVTVLGHNCRYCLHNDDHNAYPKSTQHYKNCRFRYTYSDTNASDQLLGFNKTIGFGIQANSTHIFEDCEIFIDSPSVGQSAYYGHDSATGNNGRLILRNCRIYSTNYESNKVVMLQTLTHSLTGHVQALFENCYINGGLLLALYYNNSIQSFEATFVNCNKIPVARTIPSGTIVDPYTVKWFNPLPTPTVQVPQIETDAI